MSIFFCVWVYCRSYVSRCYRVNKSDDATRWRNISSNTLGQFPFSTLLFLWGVVCKSCTWNSGSHYLLTFCGVWGWDPPLRRDACEERIPDVRWSVRGRPSSRPWLTSVTRGANARTYKEGLVLTWGRWVTNKYECRRTDPFPRCYGEVSWWSTAPQSPSRRRHRRDDGSVVAPGRRTSARHRPSTSNKQERVSGSTGVVFHRHPWAWIFASCPGRLSGEQSFRLYGRPVDYQLLPTNITTKKKKGSVRTPELCCSCELNEVSKVSGVLADRTADRIVNSYYINAVSHLRVFPI